MLLQLPIDSTEDWVRMITLGCIVLGILTALIMENLDDD